ncbi:MAG: hypothetical protein ACOC35_05290 [Promethearchaeia archaeon]
MLPLQDKIDFCTQFFSPANSYLFNNIHWQAFEYYVLAGGDYDKYKQIGSSPAQLDFLINSVHLENLLHAGNGFGKTDIIARKHIVKHLIHFYDPINNKPYKTLNVAITKDQAELVQDRIITLVNSSPVLSSFFIKSIRKNPTLEIKLINGGVIEFKTTKRKAEAVEGHEYGYITADEIALEQHLEFIREKILLPRLRKFKDGQLDWFATPKGFNAYYRIKNQIESAGGFVRSGSSYENPHINHQLLDYMIQNWSEAKVKQIVHGQFVDNANFLFASRLDNLIDNDLDFESIQSGAKYIEGWDLARGSNPNNDETVGYRIKTGAVNYIVDRWAFQLPWTEKERENLAKDSKLQAHSSIEREIRNRQKESKSKCYIDSTGVGDTLFRMVQDVAKPVDFRGNKDKILDHAQVVIDSGKLKCPYIPELVEQMTTYERDDKNLATDDVMAFCVACQGIRVIKQKIQTLDI